MSQTINQPTDAAAIIQVMRDLHGATVTGISRGDAREATFAAVPKGMEIRSLKPILDEYLQAPERRSGMAALHDLASFIAHANRFKDSGSAIFALRDEERPGLLSVLDYHEAGEGGARFGQHRGHYRFSVSEPWAKWAEVDGTPMTQSAFAELIEDRVMDIQPAPRDGRAEAGALTLDLVSTLGGKVAGPTEMLEVARGLRMTETAQVTNALNTATGEVEVMFRTEHHAAGGQKLSVPTLFIIGAPVFEGDAAYRLPMRLQYRRKEGALIWTLRRYRPELVFFDAFDAAVRRVAQETALPVFLGAPEV